MTESGNAQILGGRMTYIPQTFTVTKEEATFILHTLREAERLIQNLPSEDMQMAQAIDEVIDQRIFTDTDYFD